MHGQVGGHFCHIIMTRDPLARVSAAQTTRTRRAAPIRSRPCSGAAVAHLDTARTIQAVLRCRHSDFNIAREPSVLGFYALRNKTRVPQKHSSWRFRASRLAGQPRYLVI